MQKCEWTNLIDGREQNHKAMQVSFYWATVPGGCFSNSPTTPSPERYGQV